MPISKLEIYYICSFYFSQFRNNSFVSRLVIVFLKVRQWLGYIFPSSMHSVVSYSYKEPLKRQVDDENGTYFRRCFDCFGLRYKFFWKKNPVKHSSMNHLNRGRLTLASVSHRSITTDTYLIRMM